MSAAREAIAESGLSSLRISDVTARADLGFGTFYTYFDTKDALVEAVVAEVLESMAAAIGNDAQAVSDPAEGAAASYRRFLRFGRDEAELAGILVALNEAEGRFEDAVQPWARDTLIRGVDCGRFVIPDVELCLTTVAASAVAAIRAMLAGRIETGWETECAGAEMMLRSFGVELTEAHRIAYLDIGTLLKT
ncbi:TetR/AcrR family transcriptional regulator [Mycolicibacterium sp. A43C]